MTRPTLRDRLLIRLRHRYFAFGIGVQHVASVSLALLAVAVLARFYPVDGQELVAGLLVAVASVELGLVYAVSRGRRHLRAVNAWFLTPAGASTGAETTAAWFSAVIFARAWFAEAPAVCVLVGIPATGGTVLAFDLGWQSLFPIGLSLLSALAYGTMLNYALTEFFMEPVIARIGRRLPEDFAFSRVGIPIAHRFVVAIPVLTAAVGTLVAAVIGEGQGGGAAIATGVLVGFGAALLISAEAGLLLTRSVVEPVRRLNRAMRLVAEGDYTARAEIMRADELGELSDQFNRMAAGLEERERIRETFGTYLDRTVADYILSSGGDGTPAAIEFDVTVMFCDVRDFTAFAEPRDPAEVIATLNGIFERIVPIVDRHGGHVDKFIGDGMLAVFGAPEVHPDHGDRALRAACEMAALDLPLQVSVGLNSGRVMAGVIGGAGRLNFSVIGDAVNTAARVEAATRLTGDDVLLTASTRDALREPTELVSRGPMELKGKSAPVELLAPLRVEATVGGARRTGTG